MSERAQKVLKYFREQKDFMEKRVSEGIEKHRKGNFVINLRDKNGKDIENANVKVELKNHAFNFGANIFMLDTLVDFNADREHWEKHFVKGFDFSTITDYKERNEKFKEYFKDMWNYATIPFYWRALEPEKGKTRYFEDVPHINRRPAPMHCVKFCEENGIRMKAHCLNYDGHDPKWVQELETREEVKAELDHHFKECADIFAEHIPCWEVTNETLVLYPQPGGETVFYRDEDFVSWSFDKARKYFPQNQLVINDNHETCWQYFNDYRSSYYMQIKQELASGTPIDAIGLQYHVFYKQDKEEEMAKYFYNPEFIYRVLDRYSDFDLPLQITEITIPAYSDSVEDEEIQAEIIKNLYSIWFSCENMESVVYWNLVEGYLGPILDMNAGENYYRGGFVRNDFTKKPAWYALHNLIHNEWHTKEEGNANNGKFDFRGFYGEYDVEIIVDGETIAKRVTLDKTTNEITIEI